MSIMRKIGKKVVTMTSWTKRIDNCATVVNAVFKGFEKPDVMFLNLSEEEFPKKEDELPKELLEMTRKYKNFRINWVPGPNTKSMKKIFPILPLLDDDDVILFIDDDQLIPSDLLKCRIIEYDAYGRKCAITSGTAKSHISKGLVLG